MEQYVYFIKLLKDDYELPHVKAFVNKDLADFYYQKDVIYYRKKGWEVEENEENCGGYAIRRANMFRKDDDGYDVATLIMERHQIIKN